MASLTDAEIFDQGVDSTVILPRPRDTSWDNLPDPRWVSHGRKDTLAYFALAARIIREDRAGNPYHLGR